MLTLVGPKVLSSAASVTSAVSIDLAAIPVMGEAPGETPAMIDASIRAAQTHPSN